MAKKRSKDFTAPNTAELEAEKRKLLIDQSNPDRLKEVQSRLDYINWGIK